MATSDVALCIPWRASVDRVPLLGEVLGWYAKNMPLRTFLGDSDSEPFSRAQAINHAAWVAYRAGCSIAVINDADTIPELVPLLNAIEQTRKDREPRLPYDTYYLLNARESARFIRGDWFDLRATRKYPSVSGILVVDLDWFTSEDEFNGFDPRYVGWGHEDNDWAARAQPRRVLGSVYALHHEAERGGPATEANHLIYKDTYGVVD